MKVLDHVKMMLRLALKDPNDMVDLTKWMMAYTFNHYPNKDVFYELMQKSSEFYSTSASLDAVKEDNDE